jgi:threonine/homoserine/homoserine lactone efflux protein
MQLQTSLQQGFHKGMAVALGATSSDALIMTACISGLMKVNMHQHTGKLLGIFGVLILFVSGLYMLKRPRSSTQQNTEERGQQTVFSFFLKGLMVNTLNPFIFAFWLGVMSYITMKYEHTHALILQFMLGVIMTICLTDLLKVYLSNWLKKLMSTDHIHYTTILTGVLLIAYAVRLFYLLM